MPALTGIYETVLYASDLSATARFYRDVLGIHELPRLSNLGRVFRLPNGGILLIFDAAQSSLPGREVPSHGATGVGHVAFAVDDGGLDEWRSVFSRAKVPIEREITWPTGATSMYVRDPANNVVELVQGEVWE